MAAFFATLKNGDISTVAFSANRASEIHRFDVPSGLLIAWGDPGTPVDATALFTALSDGRAPELWGTSAVLFDQLRGRIVAATDVLGLYPVSLFRSDKEIGAASATATILENRPELASSGDPAAATELLGLGQLLGNRTVFPMVYQCRPGALVCLQPGHAPEQLSETCPTLGATSSRPRQALDALVSAVDRCLRASPEAMIPLSGGLDSRLLLACALASGHQPDTFSYGARTSSDRRIALGLAGAAECWHFEADIEAEQIARHAARVGLIGAGEVAVNHAHGLLAAETLTEIAGRPLITGTGSETYRCFYYDRGAPGLELLGSPLARKHFAPRALRYVMEHMSGGRLEALATSGMPEGQEALARLEQEVSCLLEQTDTLATGLDLAYLRLRVPRFVVAGQQLLDDVHPRFHPFLDRDVVTAMSGLPVHRRMAGGFHRWAIKRLAPGLAAIDWDKTGRPLSEGLTLAERWPGLAARVGVSARYGKSGAPLTDYSAWARGADVSLLAGHVADWTGIAGQNRTSFVNWAAGLDQLRATGTLSALTSIATSASDKHSEAA
ncbi:asparagine synthetase B family protein [Nisaea denitrificans]|uniref:asparagine synthase-related protein n=1 Tax=Nisaea denitrificans TaxID=390877 RepID=UPI0003FD4C91|nr:asparagine synthetase B family protein [Nisaea denitrificans]